MEWNWTCVFPGRDETWPVLFLVTLGTLKYECQAIALENESMSYYCYILDQETYQRKEQLNC